MAYGYYRLLTVDRTKCSTANLVSYPVLVSATTNVSLQLAPTGHITHTGTQASSNAVTMPCDLVFSTDTAGLNLIPWEIEFYDPTTGILLAWVYLAALNGSAAGSNSTFYMVYGDATVTIPQNTGSFAPSAVWDANFKYVGHMPDGSTLFLADSTSSGNTAGNVNSVVPAAGRVDGAASFTGANYLSLLYNSGLPINSSIGYSVSFWANAVGTTQSNRVLFAETQTSSSNAYFQIATQVVAANTRASVFLRNSAGTILINSVVSTAAVCDGNWHYVTWTDLNGAAKMYVDGALDATNFTYTRSGTYTFVSTTLGAFLRGGVGNQFITGKVDEVRLSNTVRPSTWILTEYNNMNLPGDIGTPGFLIWGDEVIITPPAGGASSEDRIFLGLEFGDLRNPSIGGYN